MRVYWGMKGLRWLELSEMAGIIENGGCVIITKSFG